LDEPTNHLDLFSKEVLEASLLDYEGTLLFISHDRYFLNKMAERIVELKPSGTDHFLGNYDEMIEKKNEIEEARLEALSKQASGSKSAANSDNTPANSYEADKQAKREERTRQRKVEQLEQEIATLEQQITELEEQLADPAIFNDYIRIQEIQAALEARKASLSTAYGEWEQYM
jgi:ATP-binding cassette subfamily F protein 3